MVTLSLNDWLIVAAIVVLVIISVLLAFTDDN